MSNGDLNSARVVILMGSDSDLPRMTQCLSSLSALEIPYDIHYELSPAEASPNAVVGLPTSAWVASVAVLTVAVVAIVAARARKTSMAGR